MNLRELSTTALVEELKRRPEVHQVETGPYKEYELRQKYSTVHTTITSGCVLIISNDYPDQIPEETRKWMDEVGIQKVSKILRYTAPRGSMMYSHEYLRDTPLDKLKALFGRHPAEPAFTMDENPID